ncbi:MAG: FMN-binding negative transcriptional regulator [Actinomycetes bacterium]
MYLPSHFTVTEWDDITSFVKNVAAADFVTVDADGQPHSTLMPCMWDTNNADDPGVLYMHMARANKQWEHIAEGARSLAIVHGPQAYVSPSNYATKRETGKVVPTWNYTAVHLSGIVEVNHDPEYLRGIVSRLTDHHEAPRDTQWKVTDAPDDYMNGQLRGIVAITLRIDRVEAKAKLSQNRSDEDQQGVREDLRQSSHARDNDIARLMDNGGHLN